MTKIEYKDFIGFYYDVYPNGYCQHLINEFERFEQNGVGSNRLVTDKVSRHLKDDYQIVMNVQNHNFEFFENQNTCNMFFNGLQKCYDEYSEQYSVLKGSGKIRATVMKLQRTSQGGGYHVWHCEQGEGLASTRAITYMLYLNSLDDKDGGETEFLYQHTRVKPQENLMIFWPAAYTHAHRGNPVLADKYKYIVTGWFYYE